MSIQLVVWCKSPVDGSSTANLHELLAVRGAEASEPRDAYPEAAFARSLGMRLERSFSILLGSADRNSCQG